MSALSFLLMILAPPLLGLVFGLLQLLGYMLLVRIGRLTSEQIPFFPLLWLRGMTLVVVLGVAVAIILHMQ